MRLASPGHGPTMVPMNRDDLDTQLMLVVLITAMVVFILLEILL